MVQNLTPEEDMLEKEYQELFEKDIKEIISLCLKEAIFIISELNFPFIEEKLFLHLSVFFIKRYFKQEEINTLLEQILENTHSKYPALKFSDHNFCKILTEDFIRILREKELMP